MPKTVTRRETKRPGPYNLRTSAATTISASNMAATLASPVTPWTPHSHQHMWPDTQLDYSQQHFNIPQTYAMPVQAPAPQPQHHHMPQHSGGAGHPGPSAPWTPDEDNRLMDAKVEGLGWNEIHQRYFPNKSGNACRKRHERLMTKMRTTTWDLGRIQAVMAAYESAGVRAQFWSKIAQQVGETRWEDVERVCFQQGLKNLGRPKQAASHSRGRSTASSALGLVCEYEQSSSHGEHASVNEYEPKYSDHHDDSGIDLGAPGPSRRSSQAMNPALQGGEMLHPNGGGYEYR